MREQISRITFHFMPFHLLKITVRYSYAARLSATLLQRLKKALVVPTNGQRLMLHCIGNQKDFPKGVWSWKKFINDQGEIAK